MFACNSALKYCLCFMSQNAQTPLIYPYRLIFEIFKMKLGLFYSM